MDQWIVMFIFISIDSQRFLQGSQVSQPPGYIGCYPISTLNLVNTLETDVNSGLYCRVSCSSYGYRYAATKDHSCKCANETRFNVYVDDAECDFTCPGWFTEHCGGVNVVSLHGTRLLEKINYPVCIKHQYGFMALTGDGTRTKTTVRYDNSATLCASLCKASQYIFSGTKKRLCICGDKIQHGIEVSSTCDSKCPGNGEETCGGEDSVSLRHTGYVTETSRPIEPKSSSDIDDTSSTQPKEDDFTDKATENPLSIFPLTDASNSVSATTDAHNTTEMPNFTRSEPSSVINGSRLMEANVTNESTRNTSFVFLSTQAGQGLDVNTKCETKCPGDEVETCGGEAGYTKASVANWFQMTAMYLWLPVGIIVAGSVVLVVCLVLRYKRLKSEVRVKRREVSSEDDPYQTLDPEFGHYVERSTQTNTTAGDNCDARYLTPINSTGTARCVKPVDSNAFAGYITPIDSNVTAGYITPIDSNVTAGYITHIDSNDVAGYITPMDSNDTKENYYVEIDA